MKPNSSITFFDTQFRKQVAANDFSLNPFEQRALPLLSGRVLDYGCGLGNLSLEAARRGCDVVAMDASSAAIERIRKTAVEENLRIEAVASDVANDPIAGKFDTIVAIGLLMFFPRDKALQLLGEIQDHVVNGGIAIVNVLIEGTTFMGMFEPGNYYLFGRNELRKRFDGWEIVLDDYDRFDAPGGTRKEFSTIAARK
jgi:tellurite methyltransferase